MSKIVTFQSAEYYELINLGWVVVQQMGGNAVMMIQDGTTCVDPRGKPETKVDTSAWKPYWLGRAISGVDDPDPIPESPHDWDDISSLVSPVGETIVIYVDRANRGAYPGGYKYYKVDVFRLIFSELTLFSSKIYTLDFDNPSKDHSLWATTTVYNTYLTERSGAIDAHHTVEIQWLASSVKGDWLLYRLAFKTDGVVTSTVPYDTWTLVLPAWLAAVGN